MFKIGDRIYCKRSLISIYDNEYRFIRGNFYLISGFYKDYFFILSDNMESSHFLHMSIKNMDRYFYNVNELRRLKLEKLECLR